MVRMIAGAVMLVAGVGLAGAAAAQGFSGSGAGGVAALRGTTASPGYVSGGYGTAETGVARVPEPVAEPRRRMAPTDVDFAPWDGRPGAFGLPF